MKSQANLRRSNFSRIAPVVPTPHQFSATPSFIKRYRYVSTSGTATPITGAGISAVPGMICIVTNSLCATIATGARLISIEAWAPPAVAALTTVEIEFYGNVNAAEKIFTDSSNSPAFPAHVRAIPPPLSTSALWQNPSVSNVPVASITAPSGIVIDVVIEYAQASDTLTVNNSVTVVTGTLGAMYYPPLDGTSTHRFTPTNLTSTF